MTSYNSYVAEMTGHVEWVEDGKAVNIIKVSALAVHIIKYFLPSLFYYAVTFGYTDRPVSKYSKFGVKIITLN